VSASRRDFLRALAQPPQRPRADPAPAPREPVAPALPDHLIERYSRQLVLAEWSEAAQLRLAGAAVLVVGAGALGSPVAAYLAGAGVGRLGVADGDVVEESNLARQVLHFTPDVGTPKAHSAAAKLRFLNPEIVVEPYHVTLDAGNAAGLVAGHDLVVDCTDAFASRYRINAACCAAGVPLVSGAVTAFTGLVMAVRPGTTACYRCAFPAPPPAGAAPSCAEAGVLGPAAGTVGSLMALEALKLLAGIEPAVTDAFLQLDLREPSLLRVRTARRADCPDCGRR
jgi:molybdopterin/thiamine biosynthesis adenylyltransferase